MAARDGVPAETPLDALAIRRGLALPETAPDELAVAAADLLAWLSEIHRREALIRGSGGNGKNDP